VCVCVCVIVGLVPISLSLYNYQSPHAVRHSFVLMAMIHL